MSVSNTFPVEEIGSVEDVKSLLAKRIAGQRRTLVIVALCFASIFIDAYDITSLSYVIGDIQREFGLDEHLTGLVSSSLSIGVLAGTIICGWLADKVGRSAIFLIDMVCFIVAALAGAASPNVTMLLICRFLMGFGIGADLPVAISLLTEFSTRTVNDRVKLQRIAALCPVWFVAAGLSAALLWVLFAFLHFGASGWQWRLSLALGAIPAIIVVPLRARYVTESPLWLAERGKWAELVEVLRRYYGIVVRYRPSAVAESMGAPVYAGGRIEELARNGGIGNIVSAASAWCYNAIYFMLPALFAQTYHLSQTRVAGLLATFNLLCAVPGGLLGVWLLGRLRVGRMGIWFYGAHLVTVLALGALVQPGMAQWSGAVLFVAGAFFFIQGAGPGCFMMLYPALVDKSTQRGRSVAISRFAVSIASSASFYCAPIAFDVSASLLLVIAAIGPAICLLLFGLGRRFVDIR